MNVVNIFVDIGLKNTLRFLGFIDFTRPKGGASIYYNLFCQNVRRSLTNK